jgi:hypothetical protein
LIGTAAGTPAARSALSEIVASIDREAVEQPDAAPADEIPLTAAGRGV